MFTLDEIEKLNRKYRYKYDFNTKKYTFINSETKQPATGAEAQRAKAAVYLQTRIHNGVTPDGLLGANVYDGFYNTNDMQKRKQMYLDSLVQDLGKLLETNGKHNAKSDFMGITRSPLDDCLRGYTSSRTTDRDKEGFSVFLADVAKDRGLKIDDFSIQPKVDGLQTEFSVKTSRAPIEKRQASVNTQNIQHNTNTAPANGQKTNISTGAIIGKAMTPEQEANRKKYVENFIDKYKKVETDENYQKRAKDEEKIAQKVIEVVNKGKFDTFPTNPHAFMRMLIAAQNISIVGERDFLAELIAMPQVNKQLLRIKNESKLESLLDANISQKLQNGEKLGHKETELETNLRLTRSSKINHGSEFENIKDAVCNNEPIDFEDSGDGKRKERITKLYALTQGNLDMYKEKPKQME